MPGGIAEATVGVGSGGAINAALLAAQILARTDPSLRARLEADRASRRDKVLSDDQELQL
jgi:phosphoribosylcarboxyaminoimidazole (NCAIR) mutase